MINYNFSTIRFFKENADKNTPAFSRNNLELDDLESIVGKNVSVYWCKTGMKRNTKNEEIEEFWDMVEDELIGRPPRLSVTDFKTPTQVSVYGKLEQFPNDKEHFRVLVDDLNYSYFNFEDVRTIIHRVNYPHCVCLNWK